MSSSENQLALVFPDCLDAELFIDNITCMMETHCNVEGIMYEIDSHPQFKEDEQGKFIYHTCTAAISNFPNTPIEHIYIDSIDSIDTSMVTITVGKLN